MAVSVSAQQIARDTNIPDEQLSALWKPANFAPISSARSLAAMSSIHGHTETQPSERIASRLNRRSVGATQIAQLDHACPGERRAHLFGRTNRNTNTKTKTEWRMIATSPTWEKSIAH